MIFRALLIPALFLAALMPVIGADMPAIIGEVTGIKVSHIEVARKKQALTLFDLFSLAVEKNEDLLISRELYLRAKEKKAQAIGSFLPRVSLRGACIYPENSRYTGGVSGISLYARQPIITGLDEFSAFRGAKREINMRKYMVGNNSMLLLGECTALFFNILKIETQIKNKEEILNLYQKTLGVLQRRVRLGRSRRSELLRVNSEIYRITAEIKSLQGNLATARHSLSVLSGIESGSPLVKPEALPPAGKINGNLSGIIDGRWDTRMLKESLEMAKLKVLQTIGEHLPSIYLEGAYRIYRKEKTSRDYYAALGAELPIFTGGITSSRIREAKSLEREALLRLKKNTRYSRENIIEAYKQLENSGEELEAFKKAYESARANYNSVTREYRLNLVTLLDVFDALTALQKARDDFQRTVLQHSYNRIKLGIETNEYSQKGIERLREPAGNPR